MPPPGTGPWRRTKSTEDQNTCLLHQLLAEQLAPGSQRSKVKGSHPLIHPSILSSFPLLIHFPIHPTSKSSSHFLLYPRIHPYVLPPFLSILSPCFLPSSMLGTWEPQKQGQGSRWPPHSLLHFPSLPAALQGLDPALALCLPFPQGWTHERWGQDQA
jgi:hypothetical protein